MNEIELDKAKEEAEKRAVKEATEKYDDLVALLILIGLSSKSKREKLTLINEQKIKIQAFNEEFAARQSRTVYTKFSQEAWNKARTFDISIFEVKKKLLPVQEEELKNLSEQLQSSLNRRLDVLIEQAKQLTIKQELIKLRETRLGMVDAEDRIQLTLSTSKPNLVFTNAKGQIVNMEAVMKLTVGDQLWTNITASQRSQWLLMGFRYCIHISVLDKRTTEICISLDHKKRDLRKDQLPPMHLGCRSKIILLKDGWDSEMFFKNYGRIL